MGADHDDSAIGGDWRERSTAAVELHEVRIESGGDERTRGQGGAADGMEFARFRSDLRDQIRLERVR